MSGNLAFIATGITTVFGVIGLLIYVVLRLNISKKPHYSEQIIKELKSLHFDTNLLNDLSYGKAKQLIESQTSISKEIINKGINPESKRSHFFILVISILLLAVAIIFYLISLSNSKTITFFKGFVYDSSSLTPVKDAKIRILNTPERGIVSTDSKGFFKSSVNNSDFRFVIEKEGYLDFALNIDISNNTVDTFFINKKKEDSSIHIEEKKVIQPLSPISQNKLQSHKIIADSVVNKNKETDLIEISIQLPATSNGFSKILVDGNEALVLSNSTKFNPLIKVSNNPNKMQLIQIITIKGDTCFLKRVFEKSMMDEFPIRFIPNCSFKS